MPRATPLPVRRAILQRPGRGRGAGAIAAELGLPERTVRHLLRRFRRGAEGDGAAPEAALAPPYKGAASREANGGS